MMIPGEWSRRPLKLRSNRVWRTYSGGRLIDEWQGNGEPQDGDKPEEWVSSVIRAANAGREELVEGLSLVDAEDGLVRSLKEVIESDPESYLGPAHFREYGTSLAVLVKVLDAAERLTIQVHPDPQFAMERFRSRFGKTEAWYVIGGRSVDGVAPYVLMGFKPHITREIWKGLFEAQDIPGMLEALHRIPVAPGDLFLVRGGVPHAIGSGCLMIEIQEPTDLTLRTERTTPRGLRLADQACHQGLGFEGMLDCFHYDAFSRDEMLRRCKLVPRLIRNEDGGTETVLIGPEATSRFRMHELNVRDMMSAGAPASFAIAIVLKGQGHVRTEAGSRVMAVKQGDSLFLPHQAGATLWAAGCGSGELRVVLCYPPGVVDA